MKDEELKISEIKGRFLQFIETQSISIYKFSIESGISKSNFSSKSLKSELGGSQISEILTYFPNLSPDWLLLGKGEMLRDDNNYLPKEEIPYIKIPIKVWEAIKLQSESIKEKDDQISRLIKIIEMRFGKVNVTSGVNG